MKEKRRTAIRIETHELTVIRFRPDESIFCAACQTKTAHLSLAQAVSVLSLDETEIRRRAADGEIHSTGATDDTLLLCGNSLAAVRRKF